MRLLHFALRTSHLWLPPPPHAHQSEIHSSSLRLWPSAVIGTLPKPGAHFHEHLITWSWRLSAANFYGPLDHPLDNLARRQFVPSFLSDHHDHLTIRQPKSRFYQPLEPKLCLASSSLGRRRTRAVASCPRAPGPSPWRGAASGFSRPADCRVANPLATASRLRKPRRNCPLAPLPCCPDASLPCCLLHSRVQKRQRAKTYSLHPSAPAHANAVIPGPSAHALHPLHPWLPSCPGPPGLSRPARSQTRRGGIASLPRCLQPTLPNRPPKSWQCWQPSAGARPAAVLTRPLQSPKRQRGAHQ
jgi:hypothetical protein